MCLKTNNSKSSKVAAAKKSSNVCLIRTASFNVFFMLRLQSCTKYFREALVFMWDGAGTTGNVHFLFYGGALLVGWALGYNCVKFWDFHGIS